MSLDFYSDSRLVCSVVEFSPHNNTSDLGTDFRNHVSLVPHHGALCIELVLLAKAIIISYTSIFYKALKPF